MKFVGARYGHGALEQSFGDRVFAKDRGLGRPSKGADIDRLMAGVDRRVQSAVGVDYVADVSVPCLLL